MATAAFDKRVFLDSYTQTAKTRKAIRKLMAKITASEDKKLPAWAARLTVTLDDGRKIKKVFQYTKGHVKNPFTTEELIEKFKWMIPHSACVLTENIGNSLIEAVLGLEKITDVVKSLIVPITPPDN